MCLYYTDQCYLPRLAQCATLSHRLPRVTASPFHKPPGCKIMSNIYCHNTSLVVLWSLVPCTLTGHQLCLCISGPICAIDIYIVEKVDSRHFTLLPAFSQCFIGNYKLGFPDFAMFFCKVSSDRKQYLKLDSHAQRCCESRHGNTPKPTSSSCSADYTGITLHLSGAGVRY